MIRGIYYFSAEVKPKLMSSQGAALIMINLMMGTPRKDDKKGHSKQITFQFYNDSFISTSNRLLRVHMG